MEIVNVDRSDETSSEKQEQLNSDYSTQNNKRKFSNEEFYVKIENDKACITIEDGDICVNFENENETISMKIQKPILQNLIQRLNLVFSKIKSPTQILNELYSGGNKDLKIIDKGSFGPPHDPLHIICVSIKNIGFFLGKSKSKQDSKQQAANRAINFLQQLNVVFSYIENTKTKITKIVNPKNDSKNEECANESDKLTFENDPELSKIIYQAVMTKWSYIFNPLNINKVISKLVPESNENNRSSYVSQDLWRFKEIAAFILISDIDQSVQVLSLGTGTKCINSEYFSLFGDVLYDCHAEVIARRGLMCVLYEQLQALMDNEINGTDKHDFILEPAESGKGFRLKKHFKLHLYISSPPCGDSRIFNFSESSAKPSKNKLAKGLLRVKMEKSQGTIPMEINYISTWDGILASCQRSTFMSCSDKVLLWNVVGVQGSLLSYFLEPIYIESLVVSQLYRYKHLIRAIHGRVNNEMLKSKLPSDTNYKLNEHKIGLYKQNSEKLDKKDFACHLSTNFSHNWYQPFNSSIDSNTHNEIEIIKIETGKNYFNNTRSRLCKYELLQRFKQLRQTNISYIVSNKDDDLLDNAMDKENDNSAKETDIEPNNKLISLFKNTYLGLKNASKSYQDSKLALFETLKASGFGTWVKKPVEIDLFEC